MEKLKAGADRINETGDELSQTSDLVANSIKTIGEQIDQFTV
jgi:methyl-accepting chemotaxis protein